MPRKTEPCCSWANFLTVHDDIIGDAELGLDQRGLFFPPPCPGASGPGLRVRLDHEGFLTLPPLLLLQQRPLWARKGRIKDWNWKRDWFSTTFSARADPVLDHSVSGPSSQ